MRPYGVKVITGPDVADVHAMGSKSSVGSLPGRSGVYRGLIHGKAEKAATRRRWARVARRANRAECVTED